MCRDMLNDRTRALVVGFTRMSDEKILEEAAEDGSRREFLVKAGKFATVTPPAITLLLGTSLGSKAIAASSGVALDPDCLPKATRGHGMSGKNSVAWRERMKLQQARLGDKFKGRRDFD